MQRENTYFLTVICELIESTKLQGLVPKEVPESFIHMYTIHIMQEQVYGVCAAKYQITNRPNWSSTRAPLTK